MKYLVMTFEAAFHIDGDIGDYIQSALDDLRGSGSARATGVRILESDEEYEQWHNEQGISEVEIPQPITIQFD